MMSYPPYGQPDQPPQDPYGQQPAYPPQQPAYPPSQPAYPPPADPYGQQAYPPQQPGYPPPQPGYPPPVDPYGAQQQAYPQYAGTPYGVAVGSQSNGLATASMILGILIIFFWLLTGVPAVITGHMALGKIKQNPMLGGRGMAIAGLVLGYISIAGTLCLGAIFIVGALSAIGASTATP